MTELLIRCDNIEERIREQKLAEKRGWTDGCYGKDCQRLPYYVHYFRKKKRRKKK